jgi:hypothetical protein
LKAARCIRWKQKNPLAPSWWRDFTVQQRRESARDYFEAKFQKKTAPSDIRKRFAAKEPVWICRLLVDLGSPSPPAKRVGWLRRRGQGGWPAINDVNFEFQVVEVRTAHPGGWAKIAFAQAVKES